MDLVSKRKLNPFYYFVKIISHGLRGLLEPSY